MRTLLKTRADLRSAGRWDIDFHLPPEGIREFPCGLLKRLDAVAGFPKDKRDPTKKPDEVFQYIDISSVDIVSGQVATPQDVEGAEAPSRARKVVCAFDLLISTCRPTRGAIAVVPQHLHNQVASTGFSLLRAKAGVNPFYLHYALRLPSTLEQFRKWSTGSSYPAILDDDVAKTLIPVPCRKEQDHIAQLVVEAMAQRNRAIHQANAGWRSSLDVITLGLSGRTARSGDTEVAPPENLPCTVEAIQAILQEMPPLDVEASGKQQSLMLGY